MGIPAHETQFPYVAQGPRTHTTNLEHDMQLCIIIRNPTSIPIFVVWGLRFYRMHILLYSLELGAMGY
jgi:hypothetical protein